MKNEINNSDEDKNYQAKKKDSHTFDVFCLVALFVVVSAGIYGIAKLIQYILT